MFAACTPSSWQSSIRVRLAVAFLLASGCSDPHLDDRAQIEPSEEDAGLLPPDATSLPSDATIEPALAHDAQEPEPPDADDPVSDAGSVFEAGELPIVEAGPISEAVGEADYYVANQTSEEILLSATDLGGNGITLLQTSVAARTEAKIYHAVEGSGGNTNPSNFFGTFTVLQRGTTLYRGVQDSDWMPGPARYTFVARVSAASAP
jgi:hypothetical protein